MGRGARHHKSMAPRCPSCKSEEITPDTTVTIIRGLEKVAVTCGACGRVWYSENRNLLPA